MRDAAPPQLAEKLIALAVPDPDWQDTIVGDLREEFATEANRRGFAAARAWYWRQSLSIATRLIAARLRGRRVQPRGWVAVADVDRGRGWFTGATRDLAYAWRGVTHRPGVSATIVVTLALALAANSTIFAVLDAIVLRPFRFPGVEQLVVLSSSDSNDLLDVESVSYADYQDWRRDLATIEQLTAAEWWDPNLSGVDQPEQVAGFRVTTEFFETLAAPPVLGRGFVRSEEIPGQHRRVVLGYELWTRRFGADPSIVGKTVRFDSEPYEVVGVAPPGLAIPMGAQVWAPLAKSREEWQDRRSTNLLVFGRLRSGATRAQAAAEVEAIAARLRREYPETNATRPARVVDFSVGMRDPGAARFLGVWQAAAILLLLIACANIANLLLARGTERSQEFAVRLALGAGRGRVVWQTLLEGAILAAFAVLLAVPFAWIALDLSRMSIPPSVIRFVPGWRYIGLSVPLFVLTALLGALATLLFAAAPAIQAARASLSTGLRQSHRTAGASRQRLWGRNLLATAQVALSVALLFASGLMLSASERAVDGSPGFDKRDLLTGQVNLPVRAYADPETRRQFVNGGLERMRALPAVESVAAVSNMPGAGSNASREIWPEGAVLLPGEVRTAFYRRISEDYFATMRIPLLAGRPFNTSDHATAQPVAIVSEAMAQRYWPGEDPIGRRFRTSAVGELITVVGVAGNVRHAWFQDASVPTFYRPLAQDPPFAMGFVIRTSGDPLALGAELRRAVMTLDPDQPVTAINSMEQVLVDRASGITFIAQAITVVAGIAFGLALTGLYCLMSFIAAGRTQEFGVRLALGAGRWDIIKLTTRQALAITVLGAAPGAAMAAGVGQLMESMLLGIVSNSYAQLAVIVLSLLIVAWIAAYLPARRAAALDPTVALRAE